MALNVIFSWNPFCTLYLASQINKNIEIKINKTVLKILKKFSCNDAEWKCNDGHECALGYT